MGHHYQSEHNCLNMKSLWCGENPLPASPVHGEVAAEADGGGEPSAPPGPVESKTTPTFAKTGASRQPDDSRYQGVGPVTLTAKFVPSQWLSSSQKNVKATCVPEDSLSVGKSAICIPRVVSVVLASCVVAQLSVVH
jgi:hypothetical protein